MKSQRRNYKIMETCELCKREFQFGPNFYQGHWLPTFEMYCCKGCVPNKQSDIPPAYERLAIGKANANKVGELPRTRSGTLIAFPENYREL